MSAKTNFGTRVLEGRSSQLPVRCRPLALALLPLLIAPGFACGASPAPPPHNEPALVLTPVLPPPGSSSSAPESVIATNDQNGPAPNSDLPGIVGSWSWNDDLATYRSDGTGVYERAGTTCFEFTYTVANGVVTQVADRDHTCAARRTNSYRIEIEGNTLTMTHVGSSFRTEWLRQ